MGTVHPPSDNQAHLDKPSLWLDQPTDESCSLLDLREDEPSLGDGEYTEEIYSLVEENGRFRGLFVQLSDLIGKASVTQDRPLP